MDPDRKNIGIAETPDAPGKKTVFADLTSVGVQVRDIVEARGFYEEVLGCSQGLNGDEWHDFHLYGHQIVCRLNPQLGKRGRVVSHYHLVDTKYVPIAHCRVVLEMREWRSLADRLKQRKTKFVIEPHRHSKGAPGLRATLFLMDPSGNAIEIQSFCRSAKENLRYERLRTLAGWVPWAVLVAFIVCCISILPKTP